MTVFYHIPQFISDVYNSGRLILSTVYKFKMSALLTKCTIKH